MSLYDPDATLVRATVARQLLWKEVHAPLVVICISPCEIML